MADSDSIEVAGRIIAEFDDEASQVVEEKTERSHSGQAHLNGESRSPFASEEAIQAARKCWAKLIREIAEPVPGKKNRLRIRDCAPQVDGWISVCCRPYEPYAIEERDVYGSPIKHINRGGTEFDISDKRALKLFAYDEKTGMLSAESLMPWTQIITIDCYRRPAHAESPSVL